VSDYQQRTESKQVATERRALQLPADIARDISQFKIRLAGSVNHIPTNGDMLKGLLVLADKHYDEIVGIIKGE
jgi:hypothetical protein